jgi:3-deoxy-D-manno-octulosonate 8-phosphate phosphatase (KDO 8-P phosphatase)
MKATNYKEQLRHITTFVFDVDGVLTDGTLLITSDGQLLRAMHIKDGYAIKTAVDRGYHICILSGGTNEGVKIRLQGLGVTHIYLGENDKAKKLEAYLATHHINPEQVLYMGDDIPDITAMQQAGLPCCPNDAAVEVKEICAYISHKNGGKGCVRDIIEQTLKVQGNWAKHTGAAYS